MAAVAVPARPRQSVLADWVRRHPFATFVFLIYLFEWAMLVPAVADARGLLAFHGPLVNALGFVSGWAGGITAAIVLALTEGRAGVRALLRRYLIWRVNIGWYLFGLAATAAFILGGIGLHVLLGGRVPDLPIAAQSPLVTALVFLVFLAFGLVANGEDLGWRGYALPQLQATQGALRASLVIGLLEGLTHLPYFFIPGDFRQQIGVVSFMTFSIAIVVVLTWVFNSTGGSVLLVAFYHAAQNAWANLLDTTPAPGPNDVRPFTLAVVLMVALAVALVAIYGPARLSRKPKVVLP